MPKQKQSKGLKWIVGPRRILDHDQIQTINHCRVSSSNFFSNNFQVLLSSSSLYIIFKPVVVRLLHLPFSNFFHESSRSQTMKWLTSSQLMSQQRFIRSSPGTRKASVSCWLGSFNTFRRLTGARRCLFARVRQDLLPCTTRFGADPTSGLRILPMEEMSPDRCLILMSFAALKPHLAQLSLG